jgi:hypothetical protein
MEREERHRKRQGNVENTDQKIKNDDENKQEADQTSNSLIIELYNVEI